MNPNPEIATFAAFVQGRLLASGDLRGVLLACKQALDSGKADGLLIFEEASGKQRDFNFQGSPETVLARALPPKPVAGPGRPKLGVTSREISLLPRHWDWLDTQPNGASAALRRLVEEARKREPDQARAKRVREATDRIMTALAGDLPNYEEASRALYARNQKRFKEATQTWPKDLRAYLQARLQQADRLESGSPA